MSGTEPDPALQRWLKKVSFSPDLVLGCWTWVGALGTGGYGTFRWRRRMHQAHRVAYIWFVGPIPAGKVLDHVCRNPACVNPAHLEPVTSRENTLRGRTVAAANARRTHCPQGHPYDAANTYRDRAGTRHCRICVRQRTLEWTRRQRRRPDKEA